MQKKIKNANGWIMFRRVFFGIAGVLCVFFYSDFGFSASDHAAGATPPSILRSFEGLRAGTLPLPHDGKIRFFAYHLDEFLEVQYLNEQGKWIESAYEQINRICRSRGDQKTKKIDRRLIELADHLQDHFQVDTIEIISCFRSEAFNQKLKEKGIPVAEKSFHIKGMAMDFHIDEITEKVVQHYLLGLGLGGVGYYGDRLMVHMDFGPVRRWASGRFFQNTEIGIFNQNSETHIRTNRLNYRKGDWLRLKKEKAVNGRLSLQKFFQGQWRPIYEFLNFKTWTITDEFGFGKFRLRYENGQTWQHSNEFYLKKL